MEMARTGEARRKFGIEPRVQYFKKPIFLFISIGAVDRDSPVLYLNGAICNRYSIITPWYRSFRPTKREVGIVLKSEEWGNDNQAWKCNRHGSSH